jgi:hypothetical protein
MLDWLCDFRIRAYPKRLFSRKHAFLIYTAICRSRFINRSETNSPRKNLHSVTHANPPHRAKRDVRVIRGAYNSVRGLLGVRYVQQVFQSELRNGPQGSNLSTVYMLMTGAAPSLRAIVFLDCPRPATCVIQFAYRPPSYASQKIRIVSCELEITQGIPAKITGTLACSGRSRWRR